MVHVFQRALPVVLLPAVALLLVGCGLEAVDTRMVARSEAGLEQFPVEIADDAFVCPNVVTVTNQPFNPSSVAAGEVEDAFGPFVPCGELVQPGQGKCSNCDQEYRTSGDSGPPLAVPAWRCPHCKSLVDPAAVLARDNKEGALAANACMKCKKYFTVTESDLLTVIDHPEEMFCPSCKKPVDPTMNACGNGACKLGGVVRNLSGSEGPCWRCGGGGVCTNCKGAGQGSGSTYGSTPANCFVCDESGHCPECDGEGFSTYDGSLPPGYSAYGRETMVVPASQRKWQQKRERPADTDG